MRISFLESFKERPRGQVLALWIFAALIFVAPLFIWPAAQDSFVLPKRVLLQAGVWLLLAAVLAQSLHGRLLRLALHPVNGFLALFVLCQGLSIIWSTSPALAQDQFTRSLQWLLFGILSQSILISDRRRLIALGWLLALSSFLVALWAVVIDFIAAFAPETIGVRATLGDWRDFISSASFGNSGHVADFIVIGFLAALAIYLTTLNRAAKLILLVVLWTQAAALIVAWSVHSNLSLIVAAPLLLYFLKRWEEPATSKRVLRRLLPATAGWLLVVSFFVLDHPVNPHGSHVWADEAAAQQSGGIFAQAFSSPRWKEGGPTRLAIWLTTLEVIRENTWVGAGAGNFTYAYPATRSEILLNTPDLAPYSALWTNAAHNSILQTWSETGIVGLLLLICAVAAAFHTIIQRRPRGDFGNNIILAAVFAMLVAFCIQAQMNFPLELPISSYLFILLLGIPIVLPQRRNENDLLMPAWRNYPLIRLGIMLKNMRVPTELQFGLNLPASARVPATVFLFVGAIFLAYFELQPLRSSVIYRPVYEGIRRPNAFDSPRYIESLAAQARRALEVDPENVDCRSALSDILVRTGQYPEAIEQLELVQRRLNSVEVYVREAIALAALGRLEESLQAWDIVFARRPEMGGVYPRQFEMWYSRKTAENPANRPPGAEVQ